MQTTHPPPPPPVWVRVESTKNPGRFYEYNSVTRETRWASAEVPPPPPAPPQTEIHLLPPPLVSATNVMLAPLLPRGSLEFEAYARQRQRADQMFGAFSAQCGPGRTPIPALGSYSASQAGGGDVSRAVNSQLWQHVLLQQRAGLYGPRAAATLGPDAAMQRDLVLSSAWAGSTNGLGRSSSASAAASASGSAHRPWSHMVAPGGAASQTAARRYGIGHGGIQPHQPLSRHMLPRPEEKRAQQAAMPASRSFRMRGPRPAAAARTGYTTTSGERPATIKGVRLLLQGAVVVPGKEAVPTISRRQRSDARAATAAARAAASAAATATARAKRIQRDAKRKRNAGGGSGSSADAAAAASTKETRREKSLAAKAKSLAVKARCTALNAAKKRKKRKLEVVAAKKEGIEAPAAEVAAASQPMKQKQKQTPKLKLKSTASPRSKRTAARLASDLVEPNPLGRRAKRVRKEVQSYDPTAEAARPQFKAVVKVSAAAASKLKAAKQAALRVATKRAAEQAAEQAAKREKKKKKEQAARRAANKVTQAAAAKAAKAEARAETAKAAKRAAANAKAKRTSAKAAKVAATTGDGGGGVGGAKSGRGGGGKRVRIGMDIEVRWQAEKQWFRGRVVKSDKKDGTHQVGKKRESIVTLLPIVFAPQCFSRHFFVLVLHLSLSLSYDCYV